ncbi:MAG: serine/threonine protein kinase [Rhodanobacteraceae bacterium]|nr:serine/threonine protein kinase [Rhodanobacteraceae bacterium]
MSDSLGTARTAAVFLELSELPAAQRHARLAALQAAEPELHEQVLLLLNRLDDSAAEPGFVLALGQSETAPAMAWAGRRLGPFELLSEIGRGGMGAVWRAQRVDGQYAQQVAIKLLHTHARDDTRRQVLLERFLRERQTLAGLKHPHIAALLDGGVDERGQPWFALELVDGLPITRYASDRHLGLAARLRLLLQVCDAVQFAHQKLIVHRDLKPDNLLVDQAGQVKLLDFGIVKLLDDGSDGAQTQTGARVFTPNYAAPEQVQGGGISVATDVYALGVILFELLVGRRPFVHSGAGLQMAQISAGWRAEAPSRALARDSGSTRRARPLRGDLDTIVLRCLAHDPPRRYPTVQALADDLRRYLDGQPIRARPDSRSYRLSKFLSRHPYGSAAAVLGLCLLLGLTTVSVLQARRAQQQTRLAEAFAHQSQIDRDLAIAQSQRLELMQEHYASVINRALSGGAAMTPDALLEMAGDINASVAANDPAARRSIELGQAELFLVRNDFKHAIELLEAMGPRRESLSDLEQVNFSETLGVSYLRVGRVDEVDEVLDAGEQAAQRLGPRKDLAQAQLKIVRAQWLRTRGEPAAAFQQALAAASLVRNAAGVSPMRYGQLLINAAQTAMFAGEVDTAHDLSSEGLAIWKQAGLQGMVTFATAETVLGNLELLAGRPAAALQVFERVARTGASVENIPSAAARESSMAKALALLGRDDEALALAEQAQQRFCAVVGADTLDCQRMRMVKIDVAQWAGRTNLARRQLAVVEAAIGPAPPAVIAHILPVSQALIALAERPDLRTVQQLQHALEGMAAQGGVGPRNARRLRLGAAERLLAGGHEALAVQLMQLAPPADPAAAPMTGEVGIDAAWSVLWTAKLAGNAADPEALRTAWEALRTQLGDDHPVVRRWRSGATGA